jgi:DNA modification methylase
VAGYLGYKYTGIELRQEQVNENINQLERFDIDNAPLWICDDSRNVDKYVGDNSVDMLFSCPPYGDLEVYSDDERDISNMEYDDFLKAYGEIISKAIKKLKNDRFAVFTVGDIRDKKGYYRGFTDDTKRIFKENGMPLYNEFILADPIGTAMLRAKGYFNAGRKVAKVHQNVLVFYKGDIKQIKENFREVINTDLSEFETE